MQRAQYKFNVWRKHYLKNNEWPCNIRNSDLLSMSVFSFFSQDYVIIVEIIKLLINLKAYKYVSKYVKQLLHDYVYFKQSYSKIFCKIILKYNFKYFSLALCNISLI